MCRHFSVTLEEMNLQKIISKSKSNFENILPKTDKYRGVSGKFSKYRKFRKIMEYSSVEECVSFPHPIVEFEINHGYRTC